MVSTCSISLEMTGDLLNFHDACGVGDSIGIKHAYLKHLPVWLLLGQNKYVEISYSQMEIYYADNPYSRLNELRINRLVRRYHGHTKHSCVTQDLFLEH